MDSDSEVNIITQAFAAKLGLKACLTNVEAQKINGSTLETFRMVLASFLVEDKLSRLLVFEELFLLANISLEVVLKIPFLIFSNVDI